MVVNEHGRLSNRHKIKKERAYITVLHFTVGYFIMSIKSYPKMSVKQTLAWIWDVQYSQRHTMINHCDRRITLLSDTDTVQSET